MNYKKCECLMCSNIFPSRRNKPRCVKGTKEGCGSTKVRILEVLEIKQEQTIEPETEQQPQKVSGFKW